LADRLNGPDVLYRSVHVYTPEMRPQLAVAMATAASVRRQKMMVDVSAGVPKRPVVKELYVDAVTGDPIGKLLIEVFFSYL